MHTPEIDICRASEFDISFVMSTERILGYEHLLGQWDRHWHRLALRDDRHAYFIARRDRARVGFAIVRDWGSPDKVTQIKRIAVAEPGLGYGKVLLSKIVDRIFLETDAYRVTLGVFLENLRALRVCTALGFIEEGISRGSEYVNGTHKDERVMTLLRPEWELRQWSDQPA